MKAILDFIVANYKVLIAVYGVVAAGVIIMTNSIFWSISRGESILEEMRDTGDYTIDIKEEQKDMRIAGFFVSLIFGALWVIFPPMLAVVLINEWFNEKRQGKRRK